jgi:chitodextrinase
MPPLFTPRRVVALLAVALAAAAVAPVAATRDARRSATLEGELLLAHSDDFAHGRANERWAIHADRRYVAVDVSRLPNPRALAGKRVALEGKRRNGVFVATGARPAGGRFASATSASLAGTRRVAIVLFNFSNDASRPWTQEAAAASVFGDSGTPNAYYREVSAGATSFAGTVFGWHTLALDNSGCRIMDWTTAADAAAGLDPTAYDHVVYAFPRASSCGWTGMAAVRGRQSWINGSMTLRTLSHELGHNLGAHHASSLSCTEGGARVALSSTCTQSEYGDPFSVMGASTRHQHTWHRAQIGWLADTSTVTASGTYTLAAAPYAASPRLVRVARGDGNFLYLELRQPFGVYDSFASSDPAVQGVTIRVAPDLSQLARSLLVDTVPSTASFADAPLAVGRTFTDPLTGVALTTVSVSATGASVRVAFGGSGGGGGADTTAPSAPATFSAVAVSAFSVALAWSASTDDVGVAGYRIFRDGTLVATTTGTAYDDAGLAAGTTYRYTVSAFDAAGNIGASASASASTPAAPAPVPPPADAIPPSAPGPITAVAGKGKRKFNLSWGASSDNVGVAGYRVYRSGQLVATVTSTSYADSLPAKVATVTYVVVAFDAAGNAGPASPPLTLAP